MAKKSKQMQTLEMPLYTYWQALYLAFYSSRLYVDVFKRWRGYGVLYLLLVIAIATIPLSLRIIYYFNHYFDEQMIAPLKQLPTLYIQNGHVVFDKPMPYFIKNKKGDVVALIDTTGTVKGMDKTYPELTVLITKDKLYFRPPKFRLFFKEQDELKGDNIYAQSLSKQSNEVFIGKEWVETSGVLKLKWVAALLVYPLMTGFIFGLYVIVLLFLAFTGQLFSIIIFKFKMSFKETCRLFLVAATAQTFILFLFMALNITLPLSGFSYIALLAVYFSYAALSVKRESKKLVLA